MEVEYYTIFKNIGMGTTIWSPLESGLLTGKYNDGIPEGSRLALEGFEWLKDRTLSEEKIGRVRELGKLAAELGTSTATLSLAWCIHNPNVTTAIIGATKEEQLKQNLQALEVLPKLTDEVVNKIEGIMDTKPQMPQY
jgi:aryl-alcohol dehydrogenase-like predicted oxidoreductase